ncbi:helix-turn-helix transcriptional regulator [Natronospira bacteriovora]|uniref:Helix-turn-helix transcriptional regulator n=1 Tax=Natronospira bacteriovora TaxID=3069753 RepID=A0ABU0W4M9_9GAMM|nr:helix-turn-helix transcriptional regulator [Natronospira sp. AB-CW4]MDQ2068979.1 helix-turn-helix transcriptional regulator [Natronospira sp. AB-CW4]
MRTVDWKSLSDEGVLGTLGERLARHRLNRNLTQAMVAREAGVARRTVSRLENGHAVDSHSLIRILRALDLLDRLDAFLPEPLPSPLALAERRGQERQRARPDAEPVAKGVADSSGWRWPDEEDQ